MTPNIEPGNLFALIFDSEDSLLKTVTPNPFYTISEQSNIIHAAFNETQIEFPDIDFSMHLCRLNGYDAGGNVFDETIAIFRHKAGEFLPLCVSSC